MSENYIRESISNLCEITSSKRIFAREYKDNGIPFYRGKEITEKYKGNLNISTELFISDDKYEEIENNHGVPKAGDLLLTSVGTLGSTYVVKDSDKFYFKDGNITWFRNLNNLDSFYLKYWFESLEGKGELKKSIIGSSQSAYTIANLKSMKISLPPLEIQQKIASILSNYDDLIENNNRRISILEKMAQKLYREWFVKFRFPGHEDVKMVESELGEIPEGWEVVSASSTMDINPRTTLSREGEKPYLSMSYLSEDSMVIKGNEYRSGNSGTKFKNSDTLFARITPSLENGKTGYVQFLDDENSIGFGSTEFIVLRSKTLTPEYVYCLARSENFRANAIKSMTGATGRQRVQNSCFDNYFFAQPSENILKQFTNIVRPMFELINALHKKNLNLRRQRDLLLPKLISGKIEA